MQIQLQHGAHVDFCNNDVRSPLNAAAYHGQLDCLQLLLELGATVGLYDNDGVSQSHNGHHDCLQLFLRHGATVDLCLNDHKSLL